MSETIESKLMQAISRAYTHDINANKEVDVYLGESIASEIEPIFYSLQSTLNDQIENVVYLTEVLSLARSRLERIQEPEFSGNGCDTAIEAIDEALEKVK